VGAFLHAASQRLWLGAVAPVLAWAARWSGRRAGAALVYHGVAERPGDRARELVPAHGRQVFEAQLRHLAQCYRVVPSAELPPAVATRRRGERFPVSVTFDDDLPSHRRLAMPLLRRLGLPATFFLSGASLSAPRAFWWERLQAGVDANLPVTALLPAGTAPGERAGIHDVATAIDRLPPDERDAVAERLRSALGADPSDAGLRTGDVAALAAASFKIGFHTLRHYRLPRLDESALARALADGREALAEIAGHELRTIAYPHGDADGRVAAAARAAGFTTGFTTVPVAVLPEDDRLLLGRLEPSRRSAGRFALRLILTLVRRA
jgi:peptidoglycan/xylan/chitin deacetylase (PgdA/CDA1 family)